MNTSTCPCIYIQTYDRNVSPHYTINKSKLLNASACACIYIQTYDKEMFYVDIVYKEKKSGRNYFNLRHLSRDKSRKSLNLNGQRGSQVSIKIQTNFHFLSIHMHSELHTKTGIILPYDWVLFDIFIIDIEKRYLSCVF